MYKRRARVVFICVVAPRTAVLAQALAQRVARQWIEPRAATAGELPLGCPASAHAGTSPSAEPVVLDSRLLHWADLVVCLDDAARRFCAGASVPARCVYWPDIVRLSGRGADDSTLNMALTERINGMVGGMRLLAAVDDKTP